MYIHSNWAILKYFQYFNLDHFLMCTSNLKILGIKSRTAKPEQIDEFGYSCSVTHIITSQPAKICVTWNISLFYSYCNYLFYC